MLRYPPADVAEKIANDPTGNEEKIWHMQVRPVNRAHTVCPRSMYMLVRLLTVAHFVWLLRGFAGGYGADADDHDSHPADEDRMKLLAS